MSRPPTNQLRRSLAERIEAGILGENEWPIPIDYEPGFRISIPADVLRRLGLDKLGYNGGELPYPIPLVVKVRVDWKRVREMLTVREDLPRQT